jgi:hypothetical protein
MAGDDNFRWWYGQIQRMSASPATAVAMIRLWYMCTSARCRLDLSVTLTARASGAIRADP